MKKTKTKTQKMRTALYVVTALVLGFTSLELNGQETSLIQISGKVKGAEKGEPLADVSVSVRGTITGTVTNSEGLFQLRTRTKLPFTLVFSSVGFQAQEVEVKQLGSDIQVAL